MDDANGRAYQERLYQHILDTINEITDGIDAGSREALSPLYKDNPNGREFIRYLVTQHERDRAALIQSAAFLLTEADHQRLLVELALRAMLDPVEVGRAMGEGLAAGIHASARGL
jgi:hypothetical protein